VFWRAAYAMNLGSVLLGLLSATIIRADDQQLVENYLKDRGAGGAAVRPITDDYVLRTFPNFSFFGVIFPRYPVYLCPEVWDLPPGVQALDCSNLFVVKEGQVDFIPGGDEDRNSLKFFFLAELGAVSSEEAAKDAAGTWLRFSQELKQDLFYTFSGPEISYMPREDISKVRGRATVADGGGGSIEVLMTIGAAGSLVNVYEKSSCSPGARPTEQSSSRRRPGPARLP
jgi:hypothetical protein